MKIGGVDVDLLKSEVYKTLLSWKLVLKADGVRSIRSSIMVDELDHLLSRVHLLDEYAEWERKSLEDMNLKEL